MALKSSFHFLFIYLVLSINCFALPPLPELITKQSTTNLRFITQDGRYTYYQKRSGSLFFSTNYKVSEMIKGATNTQYTVFAGTAQKKLVITQNEFFHNYYSIRNPEMIYLADYGSLPVRKIGYGISPRLHLNDTWISYFNPTENKITFEQTNNTAIKFSIKINNHTNPYFIPNVVMADENTLYFTDLGEGGVPGLVEFKRSISKTNLIYKANTPLVKFDLCFNNSILYFRQFGLNTSSSGTTFYKINFPFKEFSQRDLFYTSTLNDVGNIVCELSPNEIYFIKNTGLANSPLYDVAEFNFPNKKLNLLSDLRTTTSIFNMDGTLLTLDHGSYLIVKGNTDYKNIDTLKMKPDKQDAQ